MGELTNKVGRKDKARLAYLQQAGWGKPMNMMNKSHKAATWASRRGHERTFGLKCPIHPNYSGKDKPETGCPNCWKIYEKPSDRP